MHSYRPRAPILIVAVTGRALAASAARGGHETVVLDLFADRDTRAVARACRAVPSPAGLRFDRRVLLEAAAALAPPPGDLVYGSGFEGRTSLLAALAAARRLRGNAPAVVELVRDPGRLFPFLQRLGIRFPEVRHTPPDPPAGWLIKEPGGAGGTRVRRAGRRPAHRAAYYQREIEGRVLSVLFLADGQRAMVVGINEQWATPLDPSRPFLYGGAVSRAGLPAPVESDVRSRLDGLVAATGLVGLNGLDFILRDDEWLVLEVNPRPTATMELYDPDYPSGLFDAHLRACAGEELPASAPGPSRAHAIVVAPVAARIDESFVFPGWCRDLPALGTSLERGHPVCTVHAEGGTPAEATALVRARATEMAAGLSAAWPLTGSGSGQP
jgi:uncharacterized protein